MSFTIDYKENAKFKPLHLLLEVLYLFVCEFRLLYFHLFVIDAVHLEDISDVIHRYSLTLL